MTTDQIHQNLEDTATSWAARMDREAFDRAVKRRQDERRERNIQALAVIGASVCLASLVTLLLMYYGYRG